jgi:hypothetical protein
MKKEKFGVQEKGCVLDVYLTVYYSSDRFKHCPYVCVLQILLNFPV